MGRKFYVPPLGPIARLANALAYPVMCLPLVKPRGESPQLTHFWNNIRYARSVCDGLDADLMVAFKGDPDAVVRRGRWDVRFHLGSWRRYVALEAESLRYDWHVGWITKHGAGISQIPISKRVRMLLGPDDVAFFAICADDYRQVGLYEIGQGKLGDGGIYRLVPLH